MESINTKHHPTLNLHITDDGIIYQNSELLIPFIARGILYVKFLSDNPRYPESSKRKTILKTRSVKVLVWETFKGDLPAEGLWINHLDNDSSNCANSNLIADSQRAKWIPKEHHSHALYKYTSLIPQEEKPQFKPTIIIRKKKANESYPN